MSDNEGADSDRSAKTKCKVKRKRCSCGSFAKSGVQCTQCFSIYHSGCLNKVKECCNVSLLVSNLQTVPAMGGNKEPLYRCEYSNELVKTYKDLITELKLSNNLLLEKVYRLEAENKMLKMMSSNNNSEVVNIDSQNSNEQCDIDNPTYTELENSIGISEQPKTNWTEVKSRRDRRENRTQSIATSAAQHTERVLKTPRVQKRRATTLKGTASWGEDNFSAGPQKAWLHIGRAKPEATADDIASYLKKRFPLKHFTVEKLETNNKLSSFKVGSDFDLLNNLNDPGLWPSGITVRRFNFFRPKISQKTNQN